MAVLLFLAALEACPVNICMAVAIRKHAEGMLETFQPYNGALNTSAAAARYFDVLQGACRLQQSSARFDAANASTECAACASP